MLKQFLPVCLLVFLSTLLRAAPGVYIYKPNAASSSAKAGKYLSYSRVGSTTKVITGSGRTLSITKFQPSVFLPYIDPYKHGMIRVRNLEGFKKTYSKYSAAYTKYSQARPYLKDQLSELKEVIDKLKNGEGYYEGHWVLDQSIDQSIDLKEKSRRNKQRQNSLAYLPKMRLSNGKLYTEVVVKEKLYEKVSFIHEFGAASAKYDQLPASLRRKLGEFEVEIEARKLRKEKLEAQRLASLVKTKKEQEVTTLKEKAKNEDVASQYQLALRYSSGEGVEKNKSSALDWMNKAAKSGYPDAQYALGLEYAKGEDVPQNYTTALHWYEKASEQGNSEAQLAMGELYLKGEGVTRDFEAAAFLFRKAAEKGLAKAQGKLGVCYAGGIGVNQDDNKAVELCREAANQGDADAQSWLGIFYLNGRGVTEDIEKAVEWFQKSAKQGNRLAQFSLGGILLNGKKGVPVDSRQGLMWLKKAEDQGSEGAASLIKKYKKQKKSVKTKKRSSQSEPDHMEYTMNALFGGTLIVGEVYKHVGVVQSVQEEGIMTFNEVIEQLDVVLIPPEKLASAPLFKGATIICSVEFLGYKFYELTNGAKNRFPTYRLIEIEYAGR